MFKTRFRIVVDLLFLVTVIAVIVILLVKPFKNASSTPSAAQVTAVDRWLAARPLPRGIRLNRTDTACQVPADLCLTSLQSARTLGPALAQVLRSGGASVTTTPCERLGCLDEAHYRGVEIAVSTHTLTGYRTGASFALFEIQGSPVTSAATQPLPPLGSLHLFPAGVHTSLACLDRLARGCTNLTGALHASVDVDAATLAHHWQLSLISAGWLSRESCIGPGAAERCHMLATRSLEPDGGRFIAMQVTLEPHSHRTVGGTVTVGSL